MALIRKRILSVLMILTFVYLMRSLTAYAVMTFHAITLLLHSILFITLTSLSASVRQVKRLRTIGHSLRFTIYFM